MKLASPPYVAVITWAQTSRRSVVTLARPLPSSIAVPRVVGRSSQTTVPVGTPAPGAATVTVAVKVTGTVVTDGLTEEASAVTVAATVTVWINGDEVLAAELLSPP